MLSTCRCLLNFGITVFKSCQLVKTAFLSCEVTPHPSKFWIPWVFEALLPNRQGIWCTLDNETYPEIQSLSLFSTIKPSKASTLVLGVWMSTTNCVLSNLYLLGVRCRGQCPHRLAWVSQILRWAVHNLNTRAHSISNLHASYNVCTASHSFSRNLMPQRSCRSPLLPISITRGRGNSATQGETQEAPWNWDYVGFPLRYFAELNAALNFTTW